MWVGTVWRRMRAESMRSGHTDRRMSSTMHSDRPGSTYSLYSQSVCTHREG